MLAARCLSWLAPRLLAIIVLGVLTSACSSLRYYAQAAHGQGELMVHRRALQQVVTDPATAPSLAARLRQAGEARQFATRQLGLPRNRSYTSYVSLDRPYVVWNVFATPRYSVKAVPQCFPVAGCVAYRGWFSEAAAQSDAARLRAQGDDVWVGGVPAYSTLGWFADPILSSMLRWDDDELDGTIFHELAHQLIYVKGDTAFNESYASFVQDEGVREWRRARGLAPQNGQAQAMEEQFTQLVLKLRNRLATVYAGAGEASTLEAGKQREIAAFRARYAQWRERQWPGDHRYDAWVAQPINNARLLPFGLYARWTPAFAALFARAGHSWSAFHASVRELAKQPKARRDSTLRALCNGACPAAD